MSLNDELVRVGITGHVFCAPVGTTLPDDVTTDLDPAFVEVGLISEDGLTESLDVTKELLRAWQRPAGVRTLTTEVNWTWQFVCEETSPIVLDLYYGNAVTGSTTMGGVSTTNIPAWPSSTDKAWVVQIEDGDVITRYAIPKGDVTDRGETKHTFSDGTMYDITVAVLGTSVDEMGYRLTNDPEFAFQVASAS
jgi:hypothetical protein